MNIIGKKAKEEELFGHWRVYYLDDQVLRCTLTFSDSIVSINKYRISLRGTSEIFIEDDEIIFGDEHGDYFGYPRLRNDTLFLRHLDHKGEIMESFYGLKSDVILPVDVYDYQNLQVELELAQRSGTILDDSLLIADANIVIGRAKKSYKSRSIKKGDISIQVHDVIIHEEDINRYLQLEREIHEIRNASPNPDQELFIKLHVHKEISQSFIESLISSTDLAKYNVYQAYFDPKGGRIGFVLVHEVNKN